jgi:hypothetical protein
MTQGFNHKKNISNVNGFSNKLIKKIFSFLNVKIDNNRYDLHTKLKFVFVNLAIIYFF